MDDEDPKKSPERLDETKPERNERSLFEQLFGKKTEEEKLRKKLDEELKEAARKRATDFEEERRVEEKREVAETKKLKKRWRAKLVEKSQKLLDEAEARTDEQPVNGYEIAKLMVAERIVKLHAMLTDEALDLRRSEVKSLKIHIDFIGLLSEKLNKPELEVPEEVEQLYQTIAESVEEATGDIQAASTTPDTSPEPSSEQPDTPVEAPPVSEADAAYTEFAAGIVLAIRRVLRPAGQQEPIRQPGGGIIAPAPASEQAPQPSATPTAKPAESAPKSNGTIAERLLSLVKTAALPAETLKQDIFHAKTAHRLAEIVEKAETMETMTVVHSALELQPSKTSPVTTPDTFTGNRASPLYVEKPTSPDTDATRSSLPHQAAADVPRPIVPEETIIIPKQTSELAPKQSQKHQAILTAPETAAIAAMGKLSRHEAFHTAEQPTVSTPEHLQTATHETVSRASTGFELGPNKKIKFLSERELLGLAKLVDIGHGRPLSDAYKRGEIDKAGLIKILESYHKGRDYRSEFMYRRETWRRHKQSSPEYLNPSDTSAAEPTGSRRQLSPPKNLRETAAYGRDAMERTKSKLRNIGPYTREEAKRIARETKERLQRQSHVVTLFVTMLLVIILLLVVIELNIR